MSSPSKYPDWWTADVEAHRAFHEKAENARGALQDSIKQFSDNSVAFDTRGKQTVGTLFVIIGAAGYVLLQAVPLLSADDKRLMGACLTLFAGVILLMNCVWAACGKGILEATYAFYVASIIDSTKKHCAWGVANHQWHMLVLEHLRSGPKDQQELVTLWMGGKQTLYRYYSRWLNWVAAISLLLAIVCLGVGATNLWRHAG